MRLLDQQGGVTTSFTYDDHTDRIHITTTQDLSGFLDRMKAMRADTDRWAKGVKEEWLLYASIPNVVIAELKGKGIDVFNKDHEKRVLQEINQNYKYLKAVDKRHE